MSSLAILKNANRLVSENDELLSLLIQKKTSLILHFLYKRDTKNREQISRELKIPQNEINQAIEILAKHGLITIKANKIELSEIAKRRLIYGSISLGFLVGSTISADSQKIRNALSSAYKIEECIGKGATSYTFRAKQVGTHRDRTLKIFLPDTITYEQLNNAVKKRSQIQNESIPEIIDTGQIKLQFPDGNTHLLQCVALTYINGKAKTFADFLSSQDNINSKILEQFIISIGGALESIEAAGLTHGDLHERNILVTPGTVPTEARAFHLIDFIGVPSTISPELEIPSDLDNFRDHLLRAAIVTCERYPGYAARYALGEKVFRIIQNLRQNEYGSFKKMLEDFNRQAIHIPDNYFVQASPNPFAWLRVEWITSPVWLYKLFEPVQSRYETISRFGNTWISGPRGCGKSHYLRVLAFHPSVIIEAERDQELKNKLNDLEYDFHKAFGILFTCRLGEFKGFIPEAINAQSFDSATQAFLKHILVLKIWNKTLYTIKEGLDGVVPSTGMPLLKISSHVKDFRSFLEERLGLMGVVSDPNYDSIFLQCLAICTAHENSAIAVWNHPTKRPTKVKLLTEKDLDEFFSILKKTVPSLATSKFYILVDDASYGHIDFEMQMILNSLVRAAQANHCFKITCDKFMYTLESSDGRSIDPRHEVTYVDLGEISTKIQRVTPVDLSKYMARVINSRLKARGFKTNIQDLLGKSPKSSVILKALSRKSARKSDAYYAGWKIIWSLSHGSIRTLLELVEYIFTSNGVTKDTKSISFEQQNSSVREFSLRQYRSLAMLPGVLDGEPLGQKLQAIINAIGDMSRKYLREYDTGAIDRWYETISIERTDRSKLNQTARETLLRMLEYGLLLDDGLTFSRAQFGLCQRYDLNKIFTPAFETTYRVRNHMYLDKERFSKLLLTPDLFIRHYHNKLTNLLKRKQIQQKSLFADD